jgi:uncharacterized membrane protein
VDARPEVRIVTTAPGTAPRTHARFERDSLEFARVANLADAVFAIAMTLLVLGLDVGDAPPGDLGPALREVAPQLLAFLLSFALVANIWWQQHRLLSRLARLDGPLVACTLVMLGAVALVPFPTGLLGAHPTHRAAVIPFVAVFAGLTLVFVATVRCAQRGRAWRRPLPEHTYRWVQGGYGVSLAAMLVAAVVAWWWPLAGLAVLAVSSLPERLLARRAPADYGDWA